MKREIKFRFWNTKLNRMEDSYYDYMDGMDLEMVFNPESNGGRIPMQFSGLKDNNDIEIYEGDILSIKEYQNNMMLIHDMPKSERDEMFNGLALDEIKGDLKKEYKSDVKWEDGCFVIKSGSDYYDMGLGCLFGDMKYSQPVFEFLIVGNIHEHPELLSK